MKAKHDGWVVVGPKGPIASTFGVTQDDCWAEGWHYVRDKLPREWKWSSADPTWEGTVTVAKRAGYTMQKVKLTPADGGLWR